MLICYWVDGVCYSAIEAIETALLYNEPLFSFKIKQKSSYLLELIIKKKNNPSCVWWLCTFFPWGGAAVSRFFSNGDLFLGSCQVDCTLAQPQTTTGQYPPWSRCLARPTHSLNVRKVHSHRLILARVNKIEFSGFQSRFAFDDPPLEIGSNCL